jgi:uncharacterized protein involved in response to NO
LAGRLTFFSGKKRPVSILLFTLRFVWLLGCCFCELMVTGRHEKTLLLLPLIAIFAVITFLRLEPMTIFLSAAMTLFLMGVFAISFLGGRWPLYNLLDYLNGFLRLLGSMFARPLRFSGEVKKEGS